MSREALSTNPVEIESALFGINSTNLVDPKPNTIAHLKSLPKKEFFDRLPMLMPKDLYCHKDHYVHNLKYIITNITFLLLCKYTMF